MSLNFKSLRRSFSLRNNDSEDKEDRNVSNFLQASIGRSGLPKINSSAVPPSTNRKVQPNSFDDIRIIESHKEIVGSKMEYFLPYARLKPTATTGMQLTNVKRNEPLVDVTAAASAKVISSKKIKKHVLNQPFKHMESTLEMALPPTKMSKKQLKMTQEQLKKLTKINIHLSALFSAVENGQSEKAKSILESTDVNVNCVNNDALSPLDVAVLSNNRPLTKILLEHGASHGARFRNSESLGNHLNSLLEDALNKINDFTCGSYDDLGDQDADKQIDFWQRRANSLQRILRGWVQSTVPNLPNYVIIDVTSSTSVAVRVQESSAGAITTKFKIQWSHDADFVNIIDEREISDLTNNNGVMCSTFHLYNLIHGQRYYFRALSGNIKGWSAHRHSVPHSIVPSSWQDITNKPTTDNKKSLDELMAKVLAFRKLTASEIQLDAPPSTQCQYIKKKASIKQLFTATSKFQKHLKRGIYLACILHHDGKVLVTNDDSLPVIEIDENYPSNFCTELPWLMKISCNWDVVKALRNEMEKYSSSVNQFRLKLLTAISQMQSSMNLQDLGFFYYKPLQDSQGTVVLSCINYVKNPKSISVLNSRWIPLRKIQRKLLPINDASCINEIVLASVQNQIEFHQAATFKLSKGLYVGYLKMNCSMEQMQVVVPVKSPNVLPHQKIRDNPHVCAEEWEVLQEAFNHNERTEMQKRFVEAFSNAAMRLFKQMGVSTECMLKHKIYNFQLVKLSHDVSFLIICPPIEQSCSLNYPAGQQREVLLQRADLVSVPTQYFQMCQLYLYDSENIRKSARVALIMDLETAEANHCQREAFSTCEAEAAKEHLNRLDEIRADLLGYWKKICWLMEAMTFARNRCTETGINMRSILNGEAAPQTDAMDGISDGPQSEQPAVTVRSPCRLSWPNNNRIQQAAGGALSKSDQQLNRVMPKVNCGRSNDVDITRRNSENANLQASSSYESLNRFVDRYSLSKSDDTLSTSAPSCSPYLQRKRSKTINARICSSAQCVECENLSTAAATTTTHKGCTNGSETAPTTCSVADYLTNSNDGRTQKIVSDSQGTGAINKENLCNIEHNSLQFGTIQVYIANELGAGNGICLRLHVTTRTTAREIVDLVVDQCNQSVPQGNEKQSCTRLDSKEFCLYAIFCNKGRCVPDNFRPLQLQIPWRKGRLYVRRTQDTLTEIKNSRRDVHNI